MKRTMALRAIACFCAISGVARANSDYNITKPLRVCTASVQDFGSRCNGAPEPRLEGAAPERGWCTVNVDFCGYEVDAFDEIAASLALQFGRDYTYVCMGELGFDLMLRDLGSRDARFCDMAVSSISLTSDLAASGVTFSRALYSSHVAAMVLDPPRSRGSWAFMQPLKPSVWIAMLATILVTPVIVYFMDATLSSHSLYSPNRRVTFGKGIQEAIWHALSTVLSIDVFRVNSLPARVVSAAFAFVVLIVCNTYTANLVSFLTVQYYSNRIRTPSDLVGKRVVTTNTYLDRTRSYWKMDAEVFGSRDYTAMTRQLRAGAYDALVGDLTQLESIARRDASCSLHIVQPYLDPYETGIAYGRNFPNSHLQADVDAAIITARERGVLLRLEEAYRPQERVCSAVEFSETGVVSLDTLIGLWVIMGFSTLIAQTFVLGRYWYVRVKDKERARVIHGRILDLFRKIPLSGVAHLAVNRLAGTSTQATVGTNLHQSSRRVSARSRWQWAAGMIKAGQCSADQNASSNHSNAAAKTQGQQRRQLSDKEWGRELQTVIAALESIDLLLSEL